MGAERKQIFQLALDYLASVASQTVHRIFDTTAEISAYKKWRTVVFLQTGGTFRYDATSTEEIDGVYVLAATGKGAGRWLKRFGDKINVQDYGAVPDGIIETGGGTDNTAAIQKAINFCDRHNLIVWFPGIGLYRTTGQLLLKRNIRGIEMSNSSPIMPTGTGFYWAVKTEYAFSWQTCKINVVGPSVVQNGLAERVLIHGVQLNNPLRSVIQSVEAFSLQGVGIEVNNPYDCTFLTMTAEDCGNLFYYAFNMRGVQGDTANMSNVLRLQVERSHERAMYVQGDSLCVSFHNIHSEQAMVTVNLQTQPDPYTWVIGGGNCDYHIPRFNATTDLAYGYDVQYAKMAIRGAYVTVHNPRVESGIAIDFDANGNGPIDFYSGSLSGKNQSLGTGGLVRLHGSKVAYWRGVTDRVILDDVDVDTLEIGFTPRTNAQLHVKNSRIQAVTTTYVHARVLFDDTEVFSGVTAPGMLSPLPQGMTRFNKSTYYGDVALKYGRYEFFNSVIYGNVITDTAYVGLYNTSRIAGSLLIGTYRQIIIDQTSTVSGNLWNMGYPEVDLFSGGGWIEGMITRNPKTFESWQFYQGSWILLGVTLSALYKAGSPSLSDCPPGLSRTVINTVTGKPEYVFNDNGMLWCLPYVKCTGTAPATAQATIAGHYDLTSPVQANRAPVLAVPLSGPIQIMQGQGFSGQWSAGDFTDPDTGDVLTWWLKYSLDNGVTYTTNLPDWISFNPSTRTYSGTSPTPGTSYFRRGVADQGGLSAGENITYVTQANPVYNNPPDLSGYAHGNEFSVAKGTDPANWPTGYTLIRGSYNWANGELCQTGTAADTAPVLFTGSGANNRDITISLIEVSSFAATGSWIGNGVRFDLAGNNGYSLFADNGTTIGLVHHGVEVGPTTPFAIALNTKYWFRTQYYETGTNTATIYGKIWKAGDPEPSTWTIFWENQPRLNGYPAVFGGSNGAKACIDSWYDGNLVPPTDPEPDPFIEKFALWNKQESSGEYEVYLLYKTNLPVGTQVEDCWVESFTRNGQTPVFIPSTVTNISSQFPAGYQDYNLLMSYYMPLTLPQSHSTEHIKVRQTGTTNLLLDTTFDPFGVGPGQVKQYIPA